MTFENTPPRTNSHQKSPVIIVKLIDLFVDAHSRIEKFPKRNQYTIGKRIEDTLLEIISLTLLARAKTGKSELLILEKIDTHLREIMVLLRIAEKMKILKTSGYTTLSERIIELGKILGGWIRNCKNTKTDSL